MNPACHLYPLVCDVGALCLIPKWIELVSDVGVTTSVSVAQQANALSELQCATGPDWLKTYGGLGSSAGRGIGLSVSWTNSGHAMRLISWTGTDGPPVSSKNCDMHLHSGIERLSCNECLL